MTQAENNILAKVLEELTALRVDVGEVRGRLDTMAEYMGHVETSLTAIEDAQEFLSSKWEELSQAVTSIGFLKNLGSDERSSTREAETIHPPGQA